MHSNRRAGRRKGKMLYPSPRDPEGPNVHHNPLKLLQSKCSNEEVSVGMKPHTVHACSHAHVCQTKRTQAGWGLFSRRYQSSPWLAGRRGVDEGCRGKAPAGSSQASSRLETHAPSGKVGTRNQLQVTIFSSTDTFLSMLLSLLPSLPSLPHWQWDLLGRDRLRCLVNNTSGGFTCGLCLFLSHSEWCTWSYSGQGRDFQGYTKPALRNA